MTHALRRLLAAALLGVAAGGVGLAAPAQAAACTGGTGVTVVVNSSVGCDGDGGGSAASNFVDAGHSLKYAARQPGFVCRVDGAPASDPCVNASPSDAYWGLFWSDGTSGKWVYSSLGVGSLKVPAGGWVAFVFQDSNSKTWPSVTPRTATATTAAPTGGSSGAGGGTATTKPKATKKGRTSTGSTTATPSSPSATATTTSPTATPSTASTATPSPSASSSATTGPDATAAAEATRSADPEPASATASDSSTGTILVGAGVLAVLAAAGVVVWRRRG